MSQPGSTEPASGSHLASAPAANDKPSVAPSIPSMDNEAEEGEIFDEEEGEISESRPSDLKAPTTPSQPASALVGESSPTSQKQPETPELPTNKTLESVEKLEDRSKESHAEASGDDPASADMRPQDVQSGNRETDQEQPIADPAVESSLEKSGNQAAAHGSSAEQGSPDVAASVPVTGTTAKDHQVSGKTPELQEPDAPTTPALTEAAPPNPQDVSATTSKHRGSATEIQAQDTQQAPTEAAVTSVTPAATEEQAAFAASNAEKTVDMELDEKVIDSTKVPQNDDHDGRAETVPEPMQVDDAVHTPALPSDGLDAPAELSSGHASGDKQDDAEPVAQEANQLATHIKSEPLPEQHEQSASRTTQDPEPVPAGPVEDAQLPSADSAQKVESITNEVVADIHPHPQAETSRTSPSPRAGTQARTPDASRSEEVLKRAAAERDESSAARSVDADSSEARSANRGSAAPAAGRERRLERTKERSHTAERSQDREQRAREKDRRREMERVERERERERERIRESERDREMMIARENEESRLIWLSLPGNDHPQYYTDTDSDSCYGAGGALGVDLTDEEDKDLDPPPPMSFQEYHPAPSYSQSYFDESYYTSKRKRIDDAGDDGIPASSRRYRPKPMSKPSVMERFVSSSSGPLSREALPSTTMIDIDDFPVPDSSIRGEPSERPFASRIERASLPRISPYVHTDDTVEEYDTSDSDEEAMRIAEERKRRHGNRGGNRGNKLSREKGARWHRRGKLGGLTEMRMEKEIGDRVRHRVEAMQKDNVRALLSAMPDEDKAMLSQFPALRNGLIPSEAPGNARRDARGRVMPSDLSEAARIDADLGLDGGLAGASGSRLERPEHLTSTSLAPTLLKPAITPRQLLTSHTLRHTFRNPHIAALGKTALDLIESEGVVGRAVGRCWAAMERGGWNTDPEPKGDELDEVESRNGVAANGMDVDGSDAESSARYGDGGANGASSNVFGSAIDNPALSHLDKLFVTKQGLAIPRLDDMGQPIFIPPSPSTQAARAEAGMAEDAASEPVIETTLLPAQEQRSIVLAALECLHDLAADSREYVERLEEVRSRLAAVKRRRAQVWTAVRQWALDKDIEASLANGGRLSQDGTFRNAADAATAAAALSSAAAVTAAAGLSNGGSPKKRK